MFAGMQILILVMFQTNVKEDDKNMEGGFYSRVPGDGIFKTSTNNPRLRGEHEEIWKAGPYGWWANIYTNEHD